MAPAGGGAGPRALLLQAHGFEGLGAVEVGLLADHPSGRECEEVRVVTIGPGPAAEAAASDATDHQEAIPEVSQLVGFIAKVPPFGVPLPLIPNAGFETAIKGLITKSDQACRREELYVRGIVCECH